MLFRSNADSVTVILTDITEDCERNANKVESERSKIISMLAAGVAHEIGNPLNSLYLNLQLLQRMFRRGNIDLKDAAEFKPAFIHFSLNAPIGFESVTRRRLNPVP